MWIYADDTQLYVSCWRRAQLTHCWTDFLDFKAWVSQKNCLIGSKAKREKLNELQDSLQEWRFDN